MEGRELTTRLGTDLAQAGGLEEVLAGQLSPHTLAAYRRDVGLFLHFLREVRGGRTPDDWRELSQAEQAAVLSAALGDSPAALRELLAVTRAHLVAFRSWLVKAGFAVATVNRTLAGVRAIVRELHLRGLRPDNPGNGVKGLRSGGESGAIALSTDQARALLALPGEDLPAVRDRALLGLMLRNGLRAAEVVTLTLGDLGEDQGYRVARIHGKGRKQRVAKLAGPTWEALKAWIDAAGRTASGEEAPVFVPLRKYGRRDRARWLAWERPLTTQALWEIIKRRVRKALPDLGESISPHSLRRTFATIALEAGASLRRVQYAMGHEDPRTTERYDRARENLADNAADYVTRVLNGGR